MDAWPGAMEAVGCVLWLALSAIEGIPEGMALIPGGNGYRTDVESAAVGRFYVTVLSVMATGYRHEATLRQSLLSFT